MAQSNRDQVLDPGLVHEDESKKELPPPFEAPARGVIVSSGSPSPVALRRCADCGATLPSAQRRQLRCAECAAEGD